MEHRPSPDHRDRTGSAREGAAGGGRPACGPAGQGCYGLQIDGAGFSEVLVVEFG